MPDSNKDTKKVVKNTFYLYLRMLIIMCVNLYTVRIVLHVLGEEDYGINNVVAGVVAMFSFLTNTLASGSQRFFAFELGKKDVLKLNEYFNATLLCYTILSILFVVLAETIGLWFVENKLTIPESREGAAFFIYQFAVIQFVFRLFVVPHMSVIMAREQMNIYAIVSVLESALTLFSAFVLQEVTWDKLKTYSCLLFISTMIPSMIYIVYSKNRFPETQITFRVKKDMVIELISYCGWNLIGTLSGMFRSHGMNILLNVFFTPVVNAARAVAYQVSKAVNELSHSFFSAVRPQITKTYAAGDASNMIELVYMSSRLCFFLMWIFSLPLIFEIPLVLNLWLKEVPEYTILFTRLVIINALIDSLAHPLMSAVQATGNIRNYQLITGGVLILTLPIAYFFLKIGCPPQVTMYVSIAISIVAQIIRIVFAKIQINMDVEAYVKNVIIRICAVILLSSIVPMILHTFVIKEILRFFVVVGCSMVFNSIIIWIFGLQKSERKSIVKTIRTRIKNENC